MLRVLCASAVKNFTQPLTYLSPGIYLKPMRILCQKLCKCCCQATPASLANEAAT